MLRLKLTAILVLASVCPAVAMPICTTKKRVTCVVDGDTFWKDREKFRIANIDTPETNEVCTEGKRLASLATQRLAELLDGEFEITRQGLDRYGRTLATVSTSTGDVGEALVAEGLAQPWLGHKAQWCAGR